MNFRRLAISFLACVGVVLMWSMRSLGTPSAAAGSGTIRRRGFTGGKPLAPCPLVGDTICNFPLTLHGYEPSGQDKTWLAWLAERVEGGLNDVRFCCSAVTPTVSVAAKQPNRVCFCHFDPEEDRFISGAMLHHHTVWEGDLVRMLAKLLDLLPQDTLMLDVGSNLGSVGISMMAAAPPGRRPTLMFEANPETAHLLQSSLWLAGLGDQPRQVQVIQSIVGDKPDDQMPLMRLKTNLGGSTVIREAVWAAPEESLDTVRVPTTTLDRALGLSSPAASDINHVITRDPGITMFSETPFVGLLKIDVEGAESCVLTGAQNLLRHEKAPRFIVVEFWKRLSVCLDSRELVRWLVVDLNYHVLLFDGVPLDVIPDIVQGRQKDSKSVGVLHEPDDWQAVFHFSSNETTSNLLFYK